MTDKDLDLEKAAGEMTPEQSAKHREAFDAVLNPTSDSEELKRLREENERLKARGIEDMRHRIAELEAAMERAAEEVEWIKSESCSPGAINACTSLLAEIAQIMGREGK